REPAQAAQRDPRRHALGRRFLPHRGLIARFFPCGMRQWTSRALHRAAPRRNLSAPGKLIPTHKEPVMTITVAHVQPLVALVAGILNLSIPRLLNYIVALYLILVGIIGLNSIHHFIR